MVPFQETDGVIAVFGKPVEHPCLRLVHVIEQEPEHDQESRNSETPCEHVFHNISSVCVVCMRGAVCAAARDDSPPFWCRLAGCVSSGSLWRGQRDMLCSTWCEA